MLIALIGRVCALPVGELLDVGAEVGRVVAEDELVHVIRFGAVVDDEVREAGGWILVALARITIARLRHCGLAATQERAKHWDQSQREQQPHR